MYDQEAEEGRRGDRGERGEERGRWEERGSGEELKMYNGGRDGVKSEHVRERRSVRRGRGAEERVKGGKRGGGEMEGGRDGIEHSEHAALLEGDSDVTRMECSEMDGEGRGCRGLTKGRCRVRGCRVMPPSCDGEGQRRQERITGRTKRAVSEEQSRSIQEMGC